MLSTCIVLLQLARLSGAGRDVSCVDACARCQDWPVTELVAAYCSLCRECRDRRREWLQTAPARRSMAPASPSPDFYREEGFYKRDATLWNAPAGNYPGSGCPVPPSCNDGGQFAYVKVYGSTPCPPAPPCVSHTFAPPSRRTRLIRSRRTTTPPTSPVHFTNPACCPMFMPMVPYPCVLCPFGAGAYGPGMTSPSPVTESSSSVTESSGTSSGKNGASQVADELTMSHPGSVTEPVYLYIGIPKDMQSLVDGQTI